MESLFQLRAILHNVCRSGSVGDEQELFDSLVVNKPVLLNVFDVKPPSEAERRELQAGKTTIRGRQLTVNSDFANQAIFLANTLNCSEHYVATLINDVISRNPNLNTPQMLEAVVLEHHQRRRELADCLRFLLEAAERADALDATPLSIQLAAFVQDQILSLTGEKSLPSKVLSEIEKMEQGIAQAQTAKQNAPSNTAVQGTNISLGQDVYEARLGSLKFERRSLATVLFLVARQGYLTHIEVERIVPWLQNNPRHPMTYYLLTVLLGAFDPVDPDSRVGQLRQVLATTPSLLSRMKDKLQPSTEWTEPGLKATILLKWTLFLTEARHRDPSLEHKEGFRTEELETNVWNAVQGDAFSYLAISVAKLRREGTFPSGSYAGTVIRLPEAEQQPDLPDEDFRSAILQAFETLVRSAITHASSELRKIKQRQEDFNLANARSDRSRMFRSAS
ncbi:hypothetical protein EWM64_g5435, partial [Hericium alpestre]